MDRKKIDTLVVDTNAFIVNTSLQDLAENVVTCQEVVNEVTSKRQIRNLAVLPYELQIKTVFPENIQFVTEFSKKTGDYPSLSATDIKVIALTYQLEKEKVGVDHLKQAPESQRTITFQNHTTEDLKEIAGFYIPSVKVNGRDHYEDNVVDEQSTEDLCQNLAVLHCTDNTDADENKTNVEKNLFENEKRTDVKDSLSADVGDDFPENAKNSNAKDNVALVENQTDVGGCLLTSNYIGEDDENELCFDEVDPSSIFVEVKESLHDDQNEYEVEDDNECKSDDEDGESWITPNNVKQAKRQMNTELAEDKPVEVACITTDFAMQNVLKQMGLNIASVDGRVIKQLRTFILRCYACFKMTSIMTKVFCPHCGHNTLKRVGVSVEPDGSQKIHINLKKPLNSKGRKFSLPTFQGGKHSNNPRIFADQPMPHQRPTRVARTKTNILDADFIPGYSPFAMRDTTSRSAVLCFRDHREMRHSDHSRRRKK